MGNFTKLLKLGVFLLSLFFIVDQVSAQTFPNGTQTLNCCDCTSNTCDLVADSDPAPFNTADLQGYILVDVNNSTVDGDADDDLIDAFSINGTFSGVPTGDYVIYYISYSPADAAFLAPYFAPGQPIGDLLGLGVFQGDATWTSSDPAFIVIGSDLATVNDPVACACGGPLSFGNHVWSDEDGDGVFDPEEDGIGGVTVILYNADGSVYATTVTDADGQYVFTDVPPGNYYLELDFGTLPNGSEVSPTVNDNDYGDNGQTAIFTVIGDETGTFDLDAGIVLPGPCVDFAVVANAICSSDKTSYQVLLLFQGGDTGSNGYNITDNNTGAVVQNVDANSITFGPFASPDMDGFSYTISVADHPECVQTVAVTDVNCVVTAVELLRFDGEATDNGNELSWTTASENEVDYFVLEYSKTGANFAEVGVVNAAGNSSTAKDYSYTHEMFDAGSHYYRLVEVTTEGTKVVVSDVVEVRRYTEDFAITNVYPIPSDDMVSIEFTSVENSEMTIEVIDITGKVIQQQVYDAGVGQNRIDIDVSNYAAGTYFFTITDGTNTLTDKFIRN